MLQNLNRYALAAICIFTGIATVFLALHDLRTIQGMAEPGYLDWLTMAGVMSLGMSILALGKTRCFSWLDSLGTNGLLNSIEKVAVVISELGILACSDPFP